MLIMAVVMADDCDDDDDGPRENVADNGDDYSDNQHLPLSLSSFRIQLFFKSFSFLMRCFSWFCLIDLNPLKLDDQRLFLGLVSLHSGTELFFCG